MTMLEADRYENGRHYARAYAQRYGATALYAELGRRLAAREPGRFVEGFADEAILIACESEAREIATRNMGRAA